MSFGDTLLNCTWSPTCTSTYYQQQQLQQGDRRRLDSPPQMESSSHPPQCHGSSSGRINRKTSHPAKYDTDGGQCTTDYFFELENGVMPGTPGFPFAQRNVTNRWVPTEHEITLLFIAYINFSQHLSTPLLPCRRGDSSTWPLEMNSR